MSFGEDIAKIAQISEMPSNSLIFLSRGQHDDGVFLGFRVLEEAHGGIGGLPLVVSELVHGCCFLSAKNGKGAGKPDAL